MFVKYVPSVDDMVVGVVLDRHGEAYKVDVGSAATASLPILGFEGASKKNRPMLKVIISQNKTKQHTSKHHTYVMKRIFHLFFFLISM